MPTAGLDGRQVAAGRRPASAGRLLPLAKWAVALLSIGLLLWLVDWRGSVGLLRRVDPGLALAAWGLDLSCVLVSAWKWQRLLAALAVRVGLGALFRAYWIGAFVSGLLPSTVGGDFVRAALTRRYARAAPVAASIVVERLTGFLVLLLLALAAVLARPDLLAAQGGPQLRAVLVLALAGGCAALLAAGWLILRPRTPASGQAVAAAVAAAAAAPAGGGWAGRARGFAARLKAALAGYAGRPGALLAAGAVSVPFYVLIALFQYAVIRALGVEVALADVLVIAPLVTVVAALPAAPNGIGTSEAAFVILYTQAGLSPEEALAAALLRRLVLTLTALAGGVLWLAARDARAAAVADA